MPRGDTLPVARSSAPIMSEIHPIVFASGPPPAHQAHREREQGEAGGQSQGPQTRGGFGCGAEPAAGCEPDDHRQGMHGAAAGLGDLGRITRPAPRRDPT